jgi:flagellar hook-length control protein FliK
MTVAPVLVAVVEPAAPETSSAVPAAPGFAAALAAAHQDKSAEDADGPPGPDAPRKPKQAGSDSDDAATTDPAAAGPLTALVGTAELQAATPTMVADASATLLPASEAPGGAVGDEPAAVTLSSASAPAVPGVPTSEPPDVTPLPEAAVNVAPATAVPAAPTAEPPGATPIPAAPATAIPAAPATALPAAPAAPIPAAPTAEPPGATPLPAAPTAEPPGATPLPAVPTPDAGQESGGGPGAHTGGATAAGGLAVAPRAEGTQAAAPVAASAPSAPAQPPAPADQLFGLVRPLQRAADGSYHLRMELRPPDLGRVEVRVELRDGVLHASIHTERGETADLLRNALDDLRARLDADGMRAGQLTVDDGSDRNRERERHAAPEARDGPRETAAASPAPITLEPLAEALLDVRI